MRKLNATETAPLAESAPRNGVAVVDEILRNLTARAMASAGLDEIAAAVEEKGSFQAVWDEVERMAGAMVAAFPPRT